MQKAVCVGSIHSRLKKSISIPSSSSPPLKPFFLISQEQLTLLNKSPQQGVLTWCWMPPDNTKRQPCPQRLTFKEGLLV